MTWSSQLESVFPQGQYAFPNWRAFLEHGGLPNREPGTEMPSRLIDVPKTQKTPRLIAIEPAAMQYMQQAIKNEFYDGVGRDNLLTHLIGFFDQTPNQRLAKEGSLSGELATLDLKEASDRVSCQLVRFMTEPYGILWDAIDACRSKTVDVPDHGTHTLAKFASMGSALTFPLEAMIFLVICFMGIEKELNTQLTHKALKSYVGKVRVFGDDIIVPKRFVRSVIAELEAFGFLVNANKSFWTGKFRESCGKEFYAGYDISVVKLRRRLPSSRKHVPEFISAVAFRNQLYKAGYRNTVEWLDKLIERNFYFPRVMETSPVLGKWDDDGFDIHRISGPLQVPLVKGHVVDAKIPSSHLEGWFALEKFFTVRKDLQIFDVKHLERAGRPVSVDIKTRWAPPF
jgi:hypothetical protein